MLDRETELHYYPKTMLTLEGVTHALCMAPHPDDEVFGCGGLLTLLARQGAAVQCVVMTAGDKALGQADPSHARERVAESQRAAQVLQLPAPQFLDFEDRHLACSPALVAALTVAIEQHFPKDLATPGLLLLPSLSEPHPDHQAVALAGLMAAQACGRPLRVLFCEIGAPLVPNTYLDISAVAAQKWQAVACFTSQLGIESYASHAQAFASLRAFGLGADCLAAEAFFEVDLEAVRLKGPLAALPQWPWVRSRLQLANHPQELPLVSVLVRSMDRASLAETLASAVQQGYPNTELLVINASGHPHSELDYLPQQVQCRIVNPPEGQTLDRAAAANLALAQARGELALFLDDDDLIGPTHLQRLVQALHDAPDAVGAYSGVQVLDGEGRPVRIYDLPWSQHRLAGINFLPIHAVLFRMQAVREKGLQFDASLPVLEDWDFWRRLSQGHKLVHCPGVSATYRQGLGQSGLAQDDHPNHWKGWHRQLLQRYLAQASLPNIAECVAWHALALDQLEARVDEMRAQQARQQQALTQAHADLHMQTSLAGQHQQARDQLRQELEKFSEEVKAHLARQEQTLHTQQQALTQAHADLHMQTSLVAQHQQARDRVQQELEKFSLEIRDHLAAQSAKYDALSMDSAAALSAKDALIQARDEVVRQQQVQFQESEAHRRVQQTQLQEQQEQLHASQAQCQALQAQLEAEQAHMQALKEELSKAKMSLCGRWVHVLGKFRGRA